MRAPPVREFRDALRPSREVSPGRRAACVSIGRVVWPTGAPIDDRNAQRAENAPANVGDRHGAAFGRVGLGKFSEDDSAHAFKFSRLLQVQQHAIELVWFHSHVLKQQDRAARIEFPRRAHRSFDQCDAAAEQRPFGRAARERFAFERRGPSAVRRRHRPHERVRIEPARCIWARIESAGHQRAVKRDPAKLLPQKNVDRRQIAERAKNPGLFEARRCEPVQNLRAAVSASGTQHRANLGARQSILQMFAPFREWRRKISLRLAFRGVSPHPVVEPLQSFAAALDAFFLRGACRRNHGDRAPRDERPRLARFRHGRGRQKGSIQRASEAQAHSPHRMLL